MKEKKKTQPLQKKKAMLQLHSYEHRKNQQARQTQAAVANAEACLTANTFTPS